MFYCLALFTGFVLAAADFTRIGNRTIETVCILRAPVPKMVIGELGIE